MDGFRFIKAINCISPPPSPLLSPSLSPSLRCIFTTVERLHLPTVINWHEYNLFGSNGKSNQTNKWLNKFPWIVWFLGYFILQFGLTKHKHSRQTLWMHQWKFNQRICSYVFVQQIKGLTLWDSIYTSILWLQTDTDSELNGRYNRMVENLNGRSVSSRGIYGALFRSLKTNASETFCKQYIANEWTNGGASKRALMQTFRNFGHNFEVKQTTIFKGNGRRCVISNGRTSFHSHCDTICYSILTKKLYVAHNTKLMRPKMKKLL